jgi:hypothetical protein
VLHVFPRSDGGCVVEGYTLTPGVARSHGDAEVEAASSEVNRAGETAVASFRAALEGAIASATPPAVVRVERLARDKEGPA